MLGLLVENKNKVIKSWSHPVKSRFASAGKVRLLKVYCASLKMYMIMKLNCWPVKRGT